MGFPDRIERTVEIAHPPAKVWAALTTAEGLGAWFGNEATIDLRPGGSAQMTWTDGHTADMRVERVEEPTVFGFTWHIYGPARGRSAPHLCRVHARTGRCGHPADRGRVRFRPAAGGRLPQGVRRPHPRAGRASWASWSTTSMPPDIEAIAEQVFVALADPSRRAILAALASGGPATATDLAARLPITRQAIAKHLALLAEAGPGDGRTGGAAPGAVPAALRPDAGGAAVPGRAGPRLGRPARRVEGPPRPVAREPAPHYTKPEDIMPDNGFTPPRSRDSSTGTTAQ